MFVLIFPTTISYMLLPVGLKYLKTTVVAIYGYLILIVATIASLALGQDRFSWTQTFAIIFICIGVYLVEVAESKEIKVSRCGTLCFKAWNKKRASFTERSCLFHHHVL